jgi:hypothetical protein
MSEDDVGLREDDELRAFELESALSTAIFAIGIAVGRGVLAEDKARKCIARLQYMFDVAVEEVVGGTTGSAVRCYWSDCDHLAVAVGAYIDGSRRWLCAEHLRDAERKGYGMEPGRGQKDPT